MERRRFLKGLGVGAAGVVVSDSSATANIVHPHGMASASFQINIDHSTGGLRSLSHPLDVAKMNWTSSPENAPWREYGLLWGLGYADVGEGLMQRAWWGSPVQIEIATRHMNAIYVVGDLEVTVTRELESHAFSESYRFRNTGKNPLPMSVRDHLGVGIVMPFDDHYTSSQDVQERRAHTHIWCGGASSWVAALRMGGRAPHLGLVVTKGALEAYSVMDRNQTTGSNTRGTFLLHPAIPELKPGETYTIAWTSFWHTGWDDFFARAQNLSDQFVSFDAPHLTAFIGETLPVRFEGRQVRNAHFDRPVPFAPTKPGETALTLHYGDGLTTKVVVNASLPLDELIGRRATFISTRQQVNDPSDPLDGAYLVYDNQLDALVRKDWGSDRNEARERVGMGVLLARWQRKTKGVNQGIQTSLERYYTFVSTKLQNPDGYVRDGLTSSRTRLYNWPWVAQLHLEMARLSGSADSLARFVTTIENFYAHGGMRFYAIGLPVLDGLTTLKASGRTSDYQRLLDLFIQHGHQLTKNGVNYPASEVNFEQAIVAPPTILFFELYLITQDAQWLEAGKQQLALLELFNGRQPDHHVNEVAIRHWDDYWFGKSRMWGDTQPHYWSTLTAIAYALYGRISNKTDYMHRADTVIRHNLSLFTPEGRGSAAFVYPASVNGQGAHFYDAYANDQDWALVHALQVGEINSSFA
jgi:hypothetical protein